MVHTLLHLILPTIGQPTNGEDYSSQPPLNMRNEDQSDGKDKGKDKRERAGTCCDNIRNQ